MREINECTAEVFRRSEKRIQDRKRIRNRVLILCIPVCLVLTTVSVTLLPALESIMRTYDEKTYGDVGGMDWDAAYSGSAADTVGEAFQSVAGAYTAVEIRTADPQAYSEKVTDRAVIANLFDTIHSLFADADMAFSDIDEDPPIGDGNFEIGEASTNLDQADSSAQRKEYTILFTTDEGVQSVYYLRGNTLLNGDTNERAVLSDVQAAELLAVFGISE